MFGKSQKVQQTIEPEKEVKERKSRFQIVKLEERIAPSHNARHNAGFSRCLHSPLFCF